MILQISTSFNPGQFQARFPRHTNYMNFTHSRKLSYHNNAITRKAHNINMQIRSSLKFAQFTLLRALRPRQPTRVRGAQRVMWHLFVCVLRSQLWGQSTVDRAQEAAAVRRHQNHHVTDQAHRSLHPDQSPGGPVQRGRLAHQRLRPFLLQWVSE